MKTTVLDNAAARNSVTEINRNSKIAGKSLERISMGEKVCSAQDDGAAYAVSEKLRAQMKSFDQLIQNVQNGSALLKTAEGGVQSIVEEIRNLKELAIESANDTNTDEDRATLQKVFLQGIANIEDIAATTDYNEKNLLDGTFGGWDTSTFLEPVVTYTSEIFTDTVMETITREITEEITEEIEQVVTQVVTDTVTYTTTHVETVEVQVPDESASGITGGRTFNIDTDGIYNLASDFTGTIKINAQNVKIVGSGTNNDVQIIGRAGGGQNLWIENLNISNSANLSAIKFQGSNNTLVVGGSNSLTGGGETAAVINVGGGLTIQGTDLNTGNGYRTTKPPSDSLTVMNTNSGGAGIGSNANGSGGNVNIGTGIVLTVDYSGTGAAIGSGAGGSIGMIQTNYDAYPLTVNTSNGNAIGYGDGGSAGEINIGNASGFNITCAGDLDTSPIIRGGSNSDKKFANIGNSTTRTVTLNESVLSEVEDLEKIFEIETDNQSNHGVLERDEPVDVNKTGLTEPTGDETAIIAENSEESGDSGGAYQTVMSEVVVTETVVSTTTRVETTTVPTTVTRTVVTGTETVEVERVVENEILHSSLEYVEQEKLTARERLKIHNGEKSHESINIDFQDMRTKALGLNEVDISTRANALAAIEVLERALEYTLNESANIGAALRRFEHTASVLTTMNTNVQASESKIRDADMAKEITNYTKASLLSQTAQAMFAHANQSSEDVLGLVS